MYIHADNILDDVIVLKKVFILSWSFYNSKENRTIRSGDKCYTIYNMIHVIGRNRREGSTLGWGVTKDFCET